MDQKKLILGIIGAIVILAIAVVAYTALFPDEETIYNEKMALIAVDMEKLENQSKELNSSSNAELTVEETDKALSLIDNMTTVIKNDTEILTDLNKSISNQTRKDYITTIIDYFNQTQSGIDDIKEMMNDYKDYKSGKLSQSEFINNVNQVTPKLEKKDKDMNKTVEKIVQMEKDYPFLLTYTNSTSLGEIYASNMTA